MEFCNIGSALQISRLTPVDLASTRTLLDFDVVFIDPVAVADRHPHFARRKADLAEFLALGRTIVWFIGPGAIHSLLPIQDTFGRAYSGTKTEFIGPDILRQFWTEAEPTMEYQAYLEGACGNPFVRVKNSQRIVASFIRSGSGLILLLPSLKRLPNPAARQAASHKFVNSLEALLQRLPPGREEVKLPAWSLQYTWTRETEIRQKLMDLETVAEQTSRDIADTSKQLQLEEGLKLLFTVKGDALVEAALEAFRELGANAMRGEPGRDDIILSFGGKSAVVEVKGKKGSAAERDAAQLEKWVAGFKEAQDGDPKGILLVNAFCETPLDERTEPAFPNQMLRYCEQRDHCLMTSTQLLGMVLTARGKEGQGASYLNTIFLTNGILGELADWKAFIQEADIPHSVQAT